METETKTEIYMDMDEAVSIEKLIRLLTSGYYGSRDDIVIAAIIKKNDIIIYSDDLEEEDRRDKCWDDFIHSGFVYQLARNIEKFFTNRINDYWKSEIK